MLENYRIAAQLMVSEVVPSSTEFHVTPQAANLTARTFLAFTGFPVMAALVRADGRTCVTER